MNDNINIVVIGAGMYSVGRGTNGFGTILPAINEWKRSGGAVGKVIFASTSGTSSEIVIKKSSKLREQTGVALDVDAEPSSGIDQYAYKEIIAKILKPALAIIAVPDHLHYEVAKECLEARLPVLIVKPLTPSSQEGLKLVKLAKSKGVYAAVEFHKRWDKANLMMRDIIKQNKIGDLLYCWVEYSQRKSIPSKTFKAWTEKTTILQYLGIHYIDIIRFATSAIPKRVMAIGQKNWLTSQGLDAYDSIQSVIEWELPNGKNFTQTILTNWIDPETSSSMSDQKIKVIGVKGRFESDQKNRGVVINVDESCVENPNPYFCAEYSNEAGEKSWKGYGIDSIKTFLSDVANINAGIINIEKLQIDRPTFSEALISTLIVEAAHKSLDQGNIWIKIKNTKIQK
jgi:D-galacturonate reductase